MYIAMASSYEYAIYNKVVLQSLFDNNKDSRITVYFGYIDDRLEPYIDEWNTYFSYTGNKILGVKIPEQYVDFGIDTMAWNPVTYARHAMFNLLPEEIERIMYLGTNILVTKNIKELYHMDLKGKTIAGPRLFDNFELEENKAWMKNRVLPTIERTALKGVDVDNWVVGSILIIDMLRWRRFFNYEKFFDSIKTHPFKFLDEEALNYVFKEDKLAFTEEVYNAVTQHEDEEKAINRAKIIHYGGPTKGWNNYGMSPEGNLWWEYAKKTDQYEELLKRATSNLWNIIKSNQEKQMYKYQIFEKYVNLKGQGIFFENLKKHNLKNLVIYGNTSFSKYVCKDLREYGINIEAVVDGYDVTSGESLLVHEFLNNYELYSNADGILIILPHDVAKRIYNFLKKVSFLQLPIWDIEGMLEIC